MHEWTKPTPHGCVSAYMLATAFPDLLWLKKQANSAFADRRSMYGAPLPTAGWPNVIMNAKASGVVRDEILGPLSVFSNRSGESTITVGQKRVTLTPGVFFISNDQEYYTLEIGPKPAETANIHFGQAFMRQAFRSMADDPGKLLEDPRQDVPAFHNRVVRTSSKFEQLIESLVAPGKSTAEEEQLFDLLSLLVIDEARLRRRQEKLTALRSSTKEEIMRRLLRVTDYLYAVDDAQPDLDELARISCLSKFHFLRLFTIAFGQTPHQFISGLKMERAQALLKTTDHDVKHIASSLGYKDPSTFSRLFQRHAGMYPSQFRIRLSNSLNPPRSL